MKTSILFLIVVFTTKVLCSSFFGHPVEPNHGKVDTDVGHIYLIDKLSGYQRYGGIQSITYYDGLFTANNSLQVLLLKVVHPSNQYEVLAASEWLKMDQNPIIGWKTVNLPSPLALTTNSYLAFNFELANPIPYYSTKKGNTDKFTSPQDLTIIRKLGNLPNSQAYRCEFKHDQMLAPSQGIRVSDTLPGSQSSYSHCRIYAYMASTEPPDSDKYFTTSIDVSASESSSNYCAPVAIKSPDQKLELVESLPNSNASVCWNITGPGVKGESTGITLTIDEQMTQMSGSETQHPDGYVYCQEGGIELIDGEMMQSFKNICKDSDSSSREVTSPSNNLIVKVTNGNAWSDVAVFITTDDGTSGETAGTYDFPRQDSINPAADSEQGPTAEKVSSSSPLWIPIVGALGAASAVAGITAAACKLIRKRAGVSPKKDKKDNSSDGKTEPDSKPLPEPKPGQKPPGRLEPLEFDHPSLPESRAPSAPPTKMRLPPLRPR